MRSIYVIDLFAVSVSPLFVCLFYRHSHYYNFLNFFITKWNYQLLFPNSPAASLLPSQGGHMTHIFEHPVPVSKAEHWTLSVSADWMMILGKLSQARIDQTLKAFLNALHRLKILGTYLM